MKCISRLFAHNRVQHYRNFGGELRPTASKQKGFEELSPRRIAEQLFAHLQPGEKVAITTRYYGEEADNSAVDELVRRLEERELQVRVVKDQNPVEDFCFLKSATKELVGAQRSSFCRWAALLGNATISRLYVLDQTGLRRKNGPEGVLRHLRSWENRELKSRIRHELYQSDEIQQLVASGTVQALIWNESSSSV
jgi:hypothetical protein